MTALLNGESVGELAISRGLHYGDGVFRTILIWDAQLIDWDRHMEKLSADCVALDLDMPNVALLQSEAMQLAKAQTRAVLKVIVMRQPGGRGYRVETRGSDRLLLRYPAPQYPDHCWDSGIEAFCPDFRLSSQSALAGLKHLNRLEQVMASRNWPKQADEGILCDQAGFLVSGTRSNLFWISAGRMYTPSLDESGVSGMMRKKIIALAEVAQIATSVVKAPLAALEQADEAFVCNSLIGIWPLRRFERREWAAPGSVTRTLASALQQPRLS